MHSAVGASKFPCTLLFGISFRHTFFDVEIKQLFMNRNTELLFQTVLYHPKHLKRLTQMGAVLIIVSGQLNYFIIFNKESFRTIPSSGKLIFYLYCVVKLGPSNQCISERDCHDSTAVCT